MRPMPVVSVQPDRELLGAAIGGGIGSSVSPFAQGAKSIRPFGPPMAFAKVNSGTDSGRDFRAEAARSRSASQLRPQ